MNLRAFSLPLVATALAVAASTLPAQAQATRTWVSGVGDDVNPCSRTAPCKTFAGAISKTAAGGIINCLDPGGFGALTITKSITIDCEGTFSGSLASFTTGVTVNGAGIIVNLRNLSIEGNPGTGLVGVNFVNGSALNIEDCHIEAFRGGRAGTGTGIRFRPPNGVAAELTVTNSTIENNGFGANGGGILVQPVGTGSAKVLLDQVKVKNNSVGVRADGTGNTGGVAMTIRDSEVSGHTATGVSAATAAGGGAASIMIENSAIVHNAGNGVNANGGGAVGAIVRIGDSTVTGNNTGLFATASGVVATYGENQINGNVTDLSGVTTVALQ